MSKEIETRKKEFISPGKQYRSKPFWAWNGRLEEKELYRQLDILKEMGFGGAFMHSRVGLETEYLGKEWMELVDKSLQYAEKIGLDLWIYDEDRWPSGSAGGMVTAEPANRSKRIQMSIFPIAERGEADTYIGEKSEKTVAAFQCRLRGYRYENLGAYLPAETDSGKTLQPHPSKQMNSTISDAAELLKEADGEYILVFSIEESAPNDNYNGFTYLDTMKPEAVEAYLASTHDLYTRQISKEGLAALQGSFTDEPHRGAYLCDFSEGNQLSIPYTDRLFSLFSDRYGYDLREKLPDIFLREKEDVFSKTAIDYLELAQELFLESYMKQYRDRCHKYGWKFTGHLLHEDSLSTQTCMLGSLMTGYEYMDIPGIDLLGEKISCRWIGKQLSSVAHQTGKKHMLTELFGCTGWQMKFEDYKAVGDWQAMMGIDVFCPHLSWYTMKGENKRDYPSSIFFQSAWYKEYTYLEQYFARIHMLTEGEPAQCRLLVLNPIHSVWARAHSGSFRWLVSNDRGIDAVESQYEETFRILMEAGIDFDYGEERLLAKYGQAAEGKLIVGQCSYDQVLLSGAETLEETTWQLLMDFTAQGGKVIVAGREPDRIRAVKDERVGQLMKRAEHIPFEAEAIKQNCRPEKALYHLDSKGQHVYLQAYKKDGDLSFVILNIDREHPAEDVNLTINGCGQLEEWNARNGEVTSLGTVVSGQKLAFRLAPGEEKLYVISSFTQEVTRETAEKTGDSFAGTTPDEEGKIEKKVNTGSEVVLKELSLREKQFSYRLSEPNVAVLDRAEVYLEKECLVRGQEILKEDRILRDALKLPYRGGEMMQPWYTEKYKPELLRERRKVKAVFSFWVDVMPDGMEIAAEADGVDTKVFLNGQQLTASGDFWIDTAFGKFTADEALRMGKNWLEVEYSYGKDSGLEAVYLLGDFGVALKDGIHLIKLPQKLSGESITTQGLPFYTGSILYETEELLSEQASGGEEQTYRIRLSDLPAALAILHGRDEAREVVAFAPYEAKMKNLCGIEMIFNRRNVFGPLHLPVDYQGTYGPETFLTQGEEWREEMQLFSQGLPASVTFLRDRSE